MTNPVENRCILRMIGQQPNEVQTGKAEGNRDWTKTKSRNYKKKDEATETPHTEEEKSKAFCQSRILKKTTGKADWKWEMHMETVLTPATGVILLIRKKWFQPPMTTA